MRPAPKGPAFDTSIARSGRRILKSMQVKPRLSHVRNKGRAGQDKARSTSPQTSVPPSAASNTTAVKMLHLIREQSIHHTRRGAGMVKVRDDSGKSIYLEVFKLPIENVGRFVQLIPPPLGLGTVDLEDGKSVKGFICEGYVASENSGYEVQDITHLQSWLEFVKQRTS